jgi:hypothetical protein
VKGVVLSLGSRKLYCDMQISAVMLTFACPAASLTSASVLLPANAWLMKVVPSVVDREPVEAVSPRGLCTRFQPLLSVWRENVRLSAVAFPGTRNGSAKLAFCAIPAAFHAARSSSASDRITRCS